MFSGITIVTNYILVQAFDKLKKLIFMLLNQNIFKFKLFHQYEHKT